MLANALCGLLTILPLMKLGAKYKGKTGVLMIVAIALYYIPYRLLNLIDMKGDLYIGCVGAWTIYLLDQKRYKSALACASLALLAKENAFLFCGSVGLYFLCFTRHRLWGMLYGLSVLGIGLWIIEWLIPKYSYFDYFFLDYYDYLGDSTFDKLQTIFLRPWVVIQNLWTTQKLFYLFIIFAPLAGFPLFSRYLILASGFLVQNLLSNNPINQDITFHHSSSIIPILIATAFLGWVNVEAKASEKSMRYWKKACIGLVCFFGVLSVLHFSIIESRVWVPTSFIKSGKEALALIPKEASVSAGSCFTVHLTYRDQLFLFPKINHADYVIVEDVDPFWPIKGDHIEFLKKRWGVGAKKEVLSGLYWGEKNYTPCGKDAYSRTLKALRENLNYSLIYNQNRVLVFKKIGF